MNISHNFLGSGHDISHLNIYLMIPWTRLEDIGRINGGDKTEYRLDDSLS